MEYKYCQDTLKVTSPNRALQYTPTVIAGLVAKDTYR